MSDPKILATFREDCVTWAKFQAKAKGKGTHASALLQKFVRDYLDDNLDSRIDSAAAAPNVDFEAMIANLRGSINSELREIKHDIIKHDISGLNLQANLTVAEQKIEALEAIATEKKSHLQLLKQEKKAA